LITLDILKVKSEDIEILRQKNSLQNKQSKPPKKVKLTDSSKNIKTDSFDLDDLNGDLVLNISTRTINTNSIEEDEDDLFI
jgi:hypothetical protein